MGREWLVAVSYPTDDEFTEIGFNDLKARLFECVIQMNLLRGHRLGFDNRAGFLFANDPENNISSLLRRAGPMHLRPSRLNLFDEFEKIFIEMIDGFPFGLRGGLSRGLPILERSFGFVANDLIFSKRGLDNLAMAQIARQPPRLLLELFGERSHYVV